MRPYCKNIHPEKNFFDHAALSLHFIPFGAHNKGYTFRGSTRPSPKFFFHFVPEKLRISQAFYLSLSNTPILPLDRQYGFDGSSTAAFAICNISMF